MTESHAIVYPDAASLFDSAAAHVTALMNQGIAAHGRFALALSGGSTPRALYERLASAPWRDKIAWDKVHFFWGDERAVPLESPHSNYRMAQDALLSRVPVPPENAHRMRGEASDLDTAAAEYEQTLRRFLSPSPGSPNQERGPGGQARLDLVLLGLGNDGHTASLFPGYAALNETKKWVVATPPAPTKPPVPRLTLTLPAINHAAQIIFLVSGGSKAALVREILAGDASDKYPAARVRSESGSPFWMLDAQAGAELRG